MQCFGSFISRLRYSTFCRSIQECNDGLCFGLTIVWPCSATKLASFSKLNSHFLSLVRRDFSGDRFSSLPFGANSMIPSSRFVSPFPPSVNFELLQVCEEKAMAGRLPLRCLFDCINETFLLRNAAIIITAPRWNILHLCWLQHAHQEECSCRRDKRGKMRSLGRFEPVVDKVPVTFLKSSHFPTHADARRRFSKVKDTVSSSVTSCNCFVLDPVILKRVLT